MYLLLNNKEIAHYLLSLIDYKKIIKEEPELTWTNIEQYLSTVDSKYLSNIKFIPKFKQKVKYFIEQDIDSYIQRTKNLMSEKRELNFKLIHDNLDYFLDHLNEDDVLKTYIKSKKENFVKTVGFKLDKNSKLIRRQNFKKYSENCLIRNTVGNEKLLVTKLDNNYPFWFIDSGYTNFLESKKTWHRLVPNHLHSNSSFLPPVDRLGNFKKFPAQWRDNGEKILIVEPGPFAASVFHIDLKNWRYDIEKELRKYTDKPIVFREKVDKKIRNNLYDEFCNEDYYAVISLNSNASTEAIWAGIPAITMGRHITNPVTASKLSDINNLKRPHLMSWLCMLSYSQFTYDELMNGTAVEIVKKYYE